GMGILIDTFIVRTITVPAMASMIGQKNWWPSHLGKSAEQVHAAHQKREQQLEQLTDQLVKMKVIPEHATRTPAPVAPVAVATKPHERSSTPDDWLVRLKLTPPRENPASVPLPTRLFEPVADDKPSVRSHLGHALPLFNLAGHTLDEGESGLEPSQPA